MHTCLCTEGQYVFVACMTRLSRVSYSAISLRLRRMAMQSSDGGSPNLIEKLTDCGVDSKLAASKSGKSVPASRQGN